MSNREQITISNIPKISAIYFALLENGYDYYAMGRSRGHISNIQEYIGTEKIVAPFFAAVKQNTCEVYPYWPRAAILETASFYLSPDGSHFQDCDALRNQIMNASNIADRERDQRLWDWIAGFPTALSEILDCEAFRNYLKWEEKWLDAQNLRHGTELRAIKNCLDVCVSRYSSPVQDIQIVINPIKCVYSADFHFPLHVPNSLPFHGGLRGCFPRTASGKVCPRPTGFILQHRLSDIFETYNDKTSLFFLLFSDKRIFQPGHGESVHLVQIVHIVRIRTTFFY